MYDNVRTHPGANIRDCMEAEGLTVGELSKRLGFDRTTVSRLLNGHHGVSAEMALALERIGWSNADFWMRCQAAYDLSVAREREQAAVKVEA